MTTYTVAPTSAEELETIARHYLIAAIWADAPEGTRPRATSESKLCAVEIPQAFLGHIGAERFQQIRDAYTTGYGAHPDCGKVAPYCAALGHDLYLTRAGHGVGFADRDVLPEDLRDYLHDQCGWGKPMGEGEVTFYRGWLYIER
jgi:hypothetical protein